VGPWVEYHSPDDGHPQHDSAELPRRGRRLISSQDQPAFFVYGEYDDGNGMWIITGVSP
jgi:hypothetical protein